MRIGFTGVRGVPALYSGFETAATEICMRLAERGHDVTVYCRNGYGDESEPEYKGIKKKYLPRIHVKVADTLSHTFFALVHMFFKPPDVVLVMNPANGPLLLIPRLRGTPVAVNVDGLEWKRTKWPKVGRAYYYFASWLCTKIATTVIADSQGMQDFYKERWNCDTYYASYGAYLEKSTRRELLGEYGLEKDDYFVVVARLEPENNTDLIVTAFEKVATDKKLIIVGGTNFKSAYLDHLKAHTKDKRVRFLGGIYDQEHLTEIMCNSFAYVHGHMVGGTNPVLLKALGCGTCVLYIDVDFNAGVVAGAGIPFPMDADGATAVFQDLVDNPDKVHKYRELAPDRIRDDYTWDMVADAYENLCICMSKGRNALSEEST